MMENKESVSSTVSVKDPSCSAENLDSLAGMNKQTDRLIASHSNTSAETLKKLAACKDAKTRENVTLNPNTPRRTLISLAESFPREFLQNPAFDLMVLESPEFLSNIYSSTLAAILRQKECPNTIVNWAFDYYSKGDDFNPVVLMAIAQNPAVEVSLIEKILLMDSSLEITASEGML